MKIYIASTFSLINKVKKLAKALEWEGHTITEKWYERPYQVEGKEIITTDLKKKYDDLLPDVFYSKPEVKLSYEVDFKGIIDADIFVFVADDMPRKYNGASVELGIALANNKLCLSIGRLETSVMFYPIIRLKTIKKLIYFLVRRNENG